MQCIALIEQTGDKLSIFFHLLHNLKTFQATDETLYLDGVWKEGSELA